MVNQLMLHKNVVAGLGLALAAACFAGIHMLNGASAAAQQADAGPAGSADVDMHMRPPKETIASIVLPPGYHLELVASEPQIISPVVCVWDGNGRMYVAEMRSYMLDVNGKGEKQPISRVSRFEDTRGDGSYAKHTVFVNHLVLPRMILPVDDRILIRETDTKDVYSYRDGNHTGVADEKTLVYQGGAQAGNLEHQPSGLLWNLDNRIYVTYEAECFRFSDGKLEGEKLPGGAGQWGIAMDDTGRMVFNTAGGENPAFDFQIPFAYGPLALKGELADGFVAVHPLLKLTDVQGGPQRLWPGGGLNHFTGCAGGCIYRGDGLPPDLEGEYILPEPVGRLIRRAHFSDSHGMRVLTNACGNDEFIKSSDPNFRPVYTATGPDGCLYICDMYHGIIQESDWTKEGSYLRPQIIKYGLDKNINGGRIYRLVHDGFQRRTAPHMLDETPAQLVAHLSDPNGWWRDTAQKLIVVRGDKSVVPALEAMLRTGTSPLGRLHALWTIDGLNSTTPSLLAEAMKDSDPHVRAAAVRISEPFIAKHDPQIAAALKAIPTDIDPEVVTQYCLSLLSTRRAEDVKSVDALAAARPAVDVVPRIVHEWEDRASGAKAEREKLAALTKKDPKFAAIYTKGKQNFMQTCIACHGADGRGAPVPGAAAGLTLAPPLVGSRRLQSDRELVCRIVLHGLEGPNDGGKTYPNTMAGFPFLDDEWLSTLLSYARYEFCNKAPPLTAADLARVRQETAKRNKPYTLKELAETFPAARASAN
jgi:mono/diheme cytochrome c family protein